MTDIAIERARRRPAPKPKKKGGKKKKLILLLLVVLLGARRAAIMPCTACPAAMAARRRGRACGRAAARRPRRDQRRGGGPRPRRRRTGRPDPRVFKTTYIPLEGNFTSNLRGGDNFVQIGLGLSTFYDDHVKENVERNMMAIRSAMILTLSEADPVEITTLSGKEALKEALKNAINRVLTNREGFGGIDDVYFTSFVTQ